MHEKIEGQGRLETMEPPEKVWQVSYRFDIVTNIVQRQARSEGRGIIQSLDGRPILEGVYRLHFDNTVLRVQNLGPDVGLETWVILSPSTQ